jgi:dTDP-4-dehydrorhamnose reductase
MSERLLITGANGQLGRALKEKYPEAAALKREDLDIGNTEQLEAVDWAQFDVIINAAAYVNANDSETQEGREKTWRANAEGPRNLARIALMHNLHLIHFSSEYVFDGTRQNHVEDETFTPLSVYGQSKAAGDIAVSLVPKQHTLRTTWVVGDGHNFIKTMQNLSDLRMNPDVVDDQYGRLTFTSELVRAVDHLLTNDIESGTYNVSNSGAVRSFAELAAKTFEIAGHDPSRVKFVSTAEYEENNKGKGKFAPRPTHSDLDLSKIQRTGFVSNDYEKPLVEYIQALRDEK